MDTNKWLIILSASILIVPIVILALFVLYSQNKNMKGK